MGGTNWPIRFMGGTNWPINRRLGGTSRRDADEEDIALSAMHSFFKGAAKDRFPKLEDRDDLWKILLTITARKVSARQRKYFADKRGGGLVSGESVFLRREDVGGGLSEMLGEEPTPEFVAQMQEQCDRMLQQLGDPLLQQIAEAKFQGYSNKEIANQIGRDVRTVDRRLRDIRDAWSQPLEDQGQPRSVNAAQ